MYILNLNLINTTRVDSTWYIEYNALSTFLEVHLDNDDIENIKKDRTL